MTGHQRKCKSCGAPEEYFKKEACSICGAYTGPAVWIRPTIIPKTPKYLKIKEEQAKVLMRAIEMLGVTCTHSRMQKGLCIPFAYPNRGVRK